MKFEQAVAVIYSYPPLAVPETPPIPTSHSQSVFNPDLAYGLDFELF